MQTFWILALTVLLVGGCKDHPTAPARARVVFDSWSGVSTADSVWGYVRNNGDAAATNVIVYASTGTDSLLLPASIAPGEKAFFGVPTYFGGKPCIDRFEWSGGVNDPAGCVDY